MFPQVKDDDWQVVVTLLKAVMEQLPNDLRFPAATKFLPALNEVRHPAPVFSWVKDTFQKLVLDPPPFPFPALTELLEVVSQKLPKLFYKPLFACAAGTKATSIFDHLRTVAMLAQFLPSFWISDAEMLLVAVMSDSRSSEKGQQSDVKPQWGQARLGQLAILIELIAHVQSERHGRDTQTVSFVPSNLISKLSDVIRSPARRFLLKLDSSSHWNIASVHYSMGRWA